jgi:hypothetical protein
VIQFTVMDTNIQAPEPQPPKLGLNRIEAAKAIGVSPATLDRLTARGLLRPCRVTYRPIYWVGELERFLKENSKPSEWSV